MVELSWLLTLILRHVDIDTICLLFSFIPLVDIAGVSISRASFKLNVYVVYIPSMVTCEQFSIFFEAFEFLFIAYECKSVIFGVFNIPTLDFHTSDCIVRLLNNLCEAFDLRQANLGRNSNGRMLNFVRSTLPSSVETAEEVMVSEDAQHPELCIK